jgi:glycosyltransferase involved in cell wall biosynthesis
MEKITILIPTHNRAKELYRCLNSVHNQTYKDLKVIIFDDGSTDQTKDVVDSFMGKLDILYEKSEINLGRGHARNKILELSNTRLSCWLDSDDTMHPDKINKQYDFFIKNSDCVFLATAMICRNSKDEYVSALGESTKKIYEGLNLNNLRVVNQIPNPTVMFITEVVKKIGFNNLMFRNEDWDHYIRAYEAGYKVNFLLDELYIYGGANWD